MFKLIFNQKCCVAILLTIVLSGCGKILTRPEVPAKVPLAPAVIYVPPCGSAVTESKSSASSEDVSWEEQVCTHLWQALKSRITGGAEKYRLARLHGAVTFRSYASLEKNIGARYRVIIGQPIKYRHKNFGVVPVRIMDISTKKQLVSVAITTQRLGADGAKGFANKLVSGLNGPRCKSEPLMAFINTNGMASNVDGCKTFRLPATH